jgi:hypothetical protein
MIGDWRRCLARRSSLQPRAWVGGVVHRLQRADADARVELGRLGGVAKISWMKRMSAPPSSINVAIVWRKR